MQQKAILPPCTSEVQSNLRAKSRRSSSKTSLILRRRMFRARTEKSRGFVAKARHNSRDVNASTAQRMRPQETKRPGLVSTFDEDDDSSDCVTALSTDDSYVSFSDLMSLKNAENQDNECGVGDWFAKLFVRRLRSKTPPFVAVLEEDDKRSNSDS
uniref:Uncharacterized protein n=1 Tax=Grammatophora oceanica TaxID=210454 RepID=A0A7S1YGX3_9STRA|mmetsp:Transcript_46362/g.69033  ORF Transcript_46362/g.69033 Transcript_46362/m.69033 type:complete len:156 (+) Transcript_46362:144-611(+)